MMSTNKVFKQLAPFIYMEQDPQHAQNSSNEEVFFPPTVIGSIVDDTTDLVQVRFSPGTRRIVIHYGVQLNSPPHLGSAYGISLAFAFAKRCQEHLGCDVSLEFGALDHAPGQLRRIDGNRYQLALCDCIVDGKALSQRHLKHFLNILESLSRKAHIPYHVQTYYAFQRIPVVRRALLSVVARQKVLGRVLSPKDGRLRLRIPCPRCGWMDKDAITLRFEDVSADSLTVSTQCFTHGVFKATITPENDQTFIAGTMLRNVLKEAWLSEESDDTVHVVVKGNDWLFATDYVSNALELLGLGPERRPLRLPVPLIEDWSGAKLSKSAYVDSDDYGSDAGFADFSRFGRAERENVMSCLWSEACWCMAEPKRLYRNYSVEYFKRNVVSKPIPLLLSIRPNPANAILRGAKRFEYRKKFTSVPPGTEVFLYVTKPVQAVLGSFRTGSPICGSPQEIISRTDASEDTRAYLRDAKHCWALPIEETRAFDSPIPIGDLRAAGVQPPRSYIRLTEEYRNLLQLFEAKSGVEEPQSENRRSVGAA